MLLSNEGDRAKGRKIARLLAEVKEGGEVFIRGLEVKGEYRGKGLATLLTAFFVEFCGVAFGSYPETVSINKPGISATLQSLGFKPKNKRMLIHSTVDSSGTTLICHSNRVVDLRPHYSRYFCKSQNIRIVSSPPEGGREVYVMTSFHSPDEAFVNERLENVPRMMYTARAIAFLGTMANARSLVFRDYKDTKE